MNTRGFFKNTILFIVVIGLLIGSASFLFIKVYEDDIKKALVKELNTYLASEVDLQKMDISLFRKFPKVAITLEGVKVRESYPGSKTNLANIRKVYFMMDLPSLFQGTYIIDKIELEGVKAHLKINRLGVANYDIFKSNGEASEGDMNMDLQSIILTDVDFTFHNEAKELLIESYIDQGIFSGKLSDNIFSLQINMAALLENYSMEGTGYIKNKILETDLRLLIDQEKGAYTFENGNFLLAGSAFNLSGNIAESPMGYDLDLNISGKDNKIETLLALLPEDISKEFSQYKGKGNIRFESKIKGQVTSTENPVVTAEFGIEDGSLANENIKLRHVNLTGSYTNGFKRNLQTSVLKLNSFSAKLKDREMKGNLVLKNFSNPHLDVGLISNLNLADLQDFLQLEDVETMTGDLFVNANFSGLIRDVEKPSTIHKTLLRGELTLKDIYLKLEGSAIPYRELYGDFKFDRSDLNIREFSGLVGESDFKLDGKFKNVTTFFFFPNKKLVVEADVESKYINLNPFFTTEEAEVTDTMPTFSLPDFLVLDLDISCKRLEYVNFAAANVGGKLLYNDQVLFLKNVDVNTMEGHMTLNGELRGDTEGNMFASVKSDIRNIRIDQLFYQLNNFGQEEITSRHLAGKVDAQVNLKCAWDPYLNARLDDLIVEADISIRDGKLTNYEPITKLAGFIRVRKLADLNFEKMNNKVVIKDQKIIIPEMEMISDEFDMSVSGVHNFENTMDYKFRINLSEILFGKREDYQTEFGVVDYDEGGNMNLFVSMTGTGSDLKFAYDKKAVGKKIVQDIKKEGREINSLIKGEPDKSDVDDYEVKWEDE